MNHIIFPENNELVSGGMCVLDGIDRVHPSALSALAPLLHHRYGRLRLL